MNRRPPSAAPRKPVTLANMRLHGSRDMMIYCGQAPRCWHAGKMSADPWPDDTVFDQIERRLVCTACGALGADVRPDWRPYTGGLRG
jgi:hypothetical protein